MERYVLRIEVALNWRVYPKDTVKMITLLLLIGLAFFSFAILIALGIGIVEAPWPILLGVLIVGLLGIRWMSMQGGAIAPTDETTAPEDSPKASSSDQPLKYRGVAYKDTSHRETSDDLDAPTDSSSPDTLSNSLNGSNALEKTDGATPDTQSKTLHGVYRGRPWQHAENASPSEKGSSSDIIYRGQRVNKPNGD
ncbi:MAG: hypothetical protein VKL39_13165 [Leptolyngbyaceae bacterium]|nr:hypothetical protein [Leptolyngbyaceae bacterium]